jgi:hypothetical protein
MSKSEEASLSTLIQTANEMEISERLTLLIDWQMI